MQGIFEIIEQRRRRYESHPFIQFLRDDRIPAAQRLSYAPYASHFVLTFADMNRYYLRQEEGSDRSQPMVNRHADEDSTHFAWFLHDLGVLGFDTQCRFSDALRFLWSEEGRAMRDLGYFVVSAARDATPTMRLVVIEAVEAMGNVWLEATLVAARAHLRHDELVYFGQHHLDRETGHAIGSAVDDLRALELPAESRDGAVQVVHGLFDRMEAFNTELLDRVRAAAEPGSPPWLGGRSSRPSPTQEPEG